MEQSTQTININGRPKKKMGRPKGTAMYNEDEIKKEHDREQGYIILHISKKKEKYIDYNIMQKRILFEIVLF